MTKVRQANHTNAAHGYGPTPAHEGVAFVATLRGTPGRDVLDTAIDALRNLHQGDSQASGILTHIPHKLLRNELGSDLPQAGRYAVGFIFHHDQAAEQNIITRVAAQEGFAVLAWRYVPVNDTIVDIEPREHMPVMSQVILTPDRDRSREEIDVGLYRLRKRVEGQSQAYFSSLSRTTIVYKGLVPASRLAVFYSDLANLNYRTEIAIVHSLRGERYRFWHQAQPHRVLAHDGQIHSQATNMTWFGARVPLMDSPCLVGLEQVVSDTQLVEGHLDEFVELLHRCGRSLTHALRMVIPEQWGRHMTSAERAFYDYTATVVEPWEGSGVTCFADGYLIGAVLDRHGSRSGRYWITETGLVVFASETGVVDLEPSTITKKGRLAPGELIAVDTVVGNVIPSDAVRAQIAGLHPYREWLEEGVHAVTPQTDLESTQRARLGEISRIDPAYHVSQAAQDAVAVLAGKSKDHQPHTTRQLTFFDRFRSQRNQLTTPYIDVVAMPEPPGIYVGPQHNILQDGPQHTDKVHLPGPALTYGQFRQVSDRLLTHTITGVYREADQSIQAALDQVRHEVDVAIQQGAQVIVASNRGAQRGRSVPIPSLLLAATAHQTLLDRGARAQSSLIIEAGDAVEPTHVMRLLEAGAEATFPFHGLQLAGEDGAVEYVQRLNASVYQLLLEAGISDYSAYLGSRRFHIVGLAEQFVEEVFSGAPRVLGTFGVDDIGHQLTRPAVFLKPVHELLSPIVSKPTSNPAVEASTLEQFFLPPEVLTITDSRQNVDLVSLAHAREVVLEPPAHHDTTRPDGLRLLIKEIKAINPQARVHVRIGTDLTCEDAASEAVNAGADVVNLVDGEYEWVLGLLALSDSPVMQRATIAVGTGLRSARDVFVAAALGAQKYRLDPQVDLYSLLQELGDLLARAGVGSLTEVFGNRDLLNWEEALRHWSDAGVNLRAIQSRKLPQTPDAPPQETDSLDEALLRLTQDALNHGEPTRINAFIGNTDMSVGARVAGEVARKYGKEGLAEDTLRVILTGSAGPSLGAYAAPGMTLIVQGEAGDYVGKGLSGGRIVVRPENTAGFFSQQNVIAGSAIGYGARDGGIYLAGEVGERLGAHNWGATIVAEGAGDAAGYRMHSGTLVILGEVGVNLGAGMDGGVVYVLDFNPDTLYPDHSQGRLVAAPLEDLDIRILTAVIAEHVESTQSRIGTILLTDPDQLANRFTKIHHEGYSPHAQCSQASSHNVWNRILQATQNT